MNFFVLGVNHKTAPVEVRERFAISESRLPEALGKLTSMEGIEEGMIVSTCNRVEIFARSQNGHCDLQKFVRDYFGFTTGEYESYIFEHSRLEAVKHVFRVASSLDSMVVGESQILGQVKEAYATARALGTVTSQLDQLLTRAFAVAKKVRNETTIATSSVSIASVAVELAEKIFGSLNGKSVYLVGAGKMCELAARHLIAHGAKKIYVANRTYDRAVALANKFDGEAIPFERLYDTAPWADIIISSTGAPHAIFRKEHGEKFLHARKNRPMFFIDIAVPRDIDPGLNDLDGIFVYNIDDLQQVVQSHIGDRRKEAVRAELMVEEEVRKFEQRAQTAEVVPTIVSLQQHLETLRQAELDRVRSRLGDAFTRAGDGGRGAHPRHHQQDHAHADYHVEIGSARSGVHHGRRCGTQALQPARRECCGAGTDRCDRTAASQRRVTASASLETAHQNQEIGKLSK